MDLGNQGIQDRFVGFRLLQKLVGVKQDLGAVGQLGGLVGVILQTGGQGTAEQGYNKHHNKGDRIILSVHMKGEARSGKKIVKNNNEKKTTCKYKWTRCNIVISDNLQGWKSLQEEIRIMIKSRMAGSVIREIKEMEGFYDERKRKYYERKGSGI